MNIPVVKSVSVAKWQCLHKNTESVRSTQDSSSCELVILKATNLSSANVFRTNTFNFESYFFSKRAQTIERVSIGVKTLIFTFNCSRLSVELGRSLKFQTKKVLSSGRWSHKSVCFLASTSCLQSCFMSSTVRIALPFGSQGTIVTTIAATTTTAAPYHYQHCHHCCTQCHQSHTSPLSTLSQVTTDH